MQNYFPQDVRSTLLRRNPTYYKSNPNKLDRDAENMGRVNQVYQQTRSLTQAMQALGNDETIAGVQGWRIKDDISRGMAEKSAAFRKRLKLSRLKGDDLNDELKRMSAFSQT